MEGKESSHIRDVLRGNRSRGLPLSVAQCNPSRFGAVVRGCTHPAQTIIFEFNADSHSTRPYRLVAHSWDRRIVVWVRGPKIRVRAVEGPPLAIIELMLLVGPTSVNGAVRPNLSSGSPSTD